ncbi:hypothetical protein [Mesorhizobium sp.]|uniref:hypothetical protein n=1 Tax=Mesorhizobium sp. TaxID=1871066 RepID=UPI000FE70370|nr:hypothetical protein [Mesorhizobium sp.]RWG02547.1 MAG: hypothetical protein EOQ54_19530 [Mesorhizobium sp.]RWH00822.1 MAG: hypothetical protein EOQ72_09490 [Mesorhizobium sp.]TIN34845.1 MAG: hypothetical protein E5Y25_26905 [Mesorhizobium sp.]TIR88858.1 MAG: hypothetical protein E5X08_29885 [Mesorhizobium sp.]
MNALSFPTFATAIPLTLNADAADRVATAWRFSLREAAEHILSIKQHQKTISEKDEMLMPGVRLHSPKYVGYCRQQLARRLPLYLASVRRVSEAEQTMELHGIAFAKSSDAWA